MIVSMPEIIDIAIMSLATGFIFKDSFGMSAHKRDDYDPLKHCSSRFDWESFKFALMVAAPAILLHELGHKFMALNFGFSATFHAAYFWLALGVILKLMNAGMIFFIPAYVSYSGAALPIQSAMIALAGPFVNLVLWLVPLAILKQGFRMRRETAMLLSMASRINMFLFIFNMIPIPGFDGFWFFSGIFRALF